jgi:hypothetical protein
MQQILSGYVPLPVLISKALFLLLTFVPRLQVLCSSSRDIGKLNGLL